MLTVGVLFGGRSGEHDVSLCSAASVVAALDPARYSVVAIGIDRDGRWYVQDRPVIVDDKDFGRVLRLEKRGSWRVTHYEDGKRLILLNTADGSSVAVDVVFPVVHGTYCEDGTLQGLLELAMVPFVGADTLGSAVGMDKDVAKRLLRDAGIPVVPWVTVSRKEWDSDRGRVCREAEAFGLPLFVKPARAGSSVGVKKVREAAGLADAVDFALRYDDKILIEKGIDAREIECAVLGNGDPRASVLGEVIPRHDFYSYESKYLDPDGAELSIPARVDEAAAEAVRRDAVRGYRALCCSGMARVDFFLEKNGGRHFLNEINTLPGFTGISMYPKLWEQTGLSYGALIDELIGLALERHRTRMSIRTDR
jgi:D-alanine-D-alanine ligase